MNKRNKSWEIVLAGLAFIAIGIYLMSNSSSDPNKNRSAAWNHQSGAPTPPAPPLPGAIVIDLQNLESLKNLEKLRDLKGFEDFEQLEFEIKNIDKLIEQHTQNEIESESLDKELQQLEQELQKIEQTDFKVTLKDKKLFINKNYNIDEAQWTEVSSGVFVFKDSFSASDLESMEFNIDFGNLNIVGDNSQTGNITLRATGNIDNADALSQQLDIEKKISSNTVFSVTSTTDHLTSSDINLEATLSLPQTLALTAKTSGGHITANNLNNQQQLNTSGGHITLADLTGTTEAQTSGGHITANRISGDTKMSTGGGHIKVDEFDGSLQAKTGGGHIEIQKARGGISARTSGGNISSSIIEANDQLTFSTSAGNISITLPKNINANLDAKGSSIQLSDAFNFSGEKDRNRITGILNDGGLPIVINCGYGTINIDSQD